jgi:hypothetical protein
MRYATVAAIALLAIASSPLTAKQDSIVMGAQYANQVWYSLTTGNSRSTTQATWDLGFEITSANGMTASVLANEGKGAVVYLVPDKTIADWDDVDTAGMSSWRVLHNSPYKWTLGALNQAANPADPFDFGWGKYNLVSHQVVGTNIFIVKTSTGVRKLRVDGFISGEYRFTYANVDGSNERSGVLAKGAYPGKLFAYWSMDSHTALDREPESNQWDLTMLKYVDLVPAGPGGAMPYPVTGILSNPSVRCAKVVSSNPEAEPLPPSDSFSEDANVIGWDWKAFAGGTYTVSDSTAYFVLTPGGKYRIVFTGFYGSSTGTTTFNVDALETSSVEFDGTQHLELSMYPNVVSRGTDVEIAADLTAPGTLLLLDGMGRLVRSESAAPGFTARRIGTGALAAGVYTVVLESGSGVVTKRIVIQ